MRFDGSRYCYLLRTQEREILESYLDQAGSVAVAAEMLEITSDRLYKRMRCLGVPAPTKARKQQETPSPEPETQEQQAEPAPESHGDQSQ